MIIARAACPDMQMILVEMVRAISTPQYIKRRAEMIIYAHNDFLSSNDLCELVGVTPRTLKKHLGRFEESLEALELLVQEGKGQRAKLKRTVYECLQDAPRTGRPRDFTPVQIVSIVSIACEKPEDSGRPISKWTQDEIADEAVQRNIVDSISSSHVGRILASVHLQPHKTKGWCFTTEKDQELFARQVQEVCDVYLEAAKAYEQSGAHTVSVDESTGLQANEQRAESLPAQPGEVAKEETQYTRHGSLCLLAAWHVVIGQVIHYATQKTRTNEDFCEFIKQMLTFDLKGKWVIVVDNLNIHSSEVLVRFIAALEGIAPASLGSSQKRKGVLGSMRSRKEFLSRAEHRVRFVFLPKHSSWLNQIEVIFGIIKRKAMNHASFRSQDELIHRLTQFIEYFNTTMAKPMNWTYTGRPTENETTEKSSIWRERWKPQTWKQQWEEHKAAIAT